MRSALPAVLALVTLVLAASAAALAAVEGSGEQPPSTQREALVLETVYLWDGPAPNAKGEAAEDRPRLYVFRPSPQTATGAAVIVCPGGGYGIRGMDSEGVQVCRWLNSIGVTAFLLAYRVGMAGYKPDDSLTDAARAVRFLRHRAAEYDVDPHRIGMLGFSAGGHLISRLALHQTPGDPMAADPVERESSRADFLLLCYTPAAETDWPKEGQPSCPVTADTPPTFIFHTTGDEVLSPDGVLLWYKGLRDAGVEVELHVFGGYGHHGVGLGTGDPSGVGRWPELAAAWIRRNGFLSGKERSSVQGIISIDGQPMYVGSITFIPLESDTDPVVYGTVQGWVEMGRYRIPANQGPVPGLYRIEARHNAVAMMLTEPVMESEAVYRKSAPDADGFMTTRIGPGDDTVDVAIMTRR